MPAEKPEPDRARALDHAARALKNAGYRVHKSPRSLLPLPTRAVVAHLDERDGDRYVEVRLTKKGMCVVELWRRWPSQQVELLRFEDSHQIEQMELTYDIPHAVHRALKLAEELRHSHSQDGGAE